MFTILFVEIQKLKCSSFVFIDIGTLRTLCALIKWWDIEFKRREDRKISNNNNINIIILFYPQTVLFYPQNSHNHYIGLSPEYLWHHFLVMTGDVFKEPNLVTYKSPEALPSLPLNFMSQLSIFDANRCVRIKYVVSVIIHHLNAIISTFDENDVLELNS